MISISSGSTNSSARFQPVQRFGEAGCALEVRGSELQKKASLNWATLISRHASEALLAYGNHKSRDTQRIPSTVVRAFCRFTTFGFLRSSNRRLLRSDQFSGTTYRPPLQKLTRSGMDEYSPFQMPSVFLLVIVLTNFSLGPD